MPEPFGGPDLATKKITSFGVHRKKTPVYLVSRTALRTTYQNSVSYHTLVQAQPAAREYPHCTDQTGRCHTVRTGPAASWMGKESARLAVPQLRRSSPPIYAKLNPRSTRSRGMISLDITLFGNRRAVYLYPLITKRSLYFCTEGLNQALYNT